MSHAIVLTVSYDGSRFAGFARQPGQETVQGRLEAALTTVMRREIIIVCAGRTDAGVHALGQVVSFYSWGAEPDEATLLRSVSALVGPDIVVTGVRFCSPRFSARYSAIGREYRYRIVPGPIPPLFLRHQAWWVKSTLDLGAMRAAASYLVGEHDFRSFCVSSSAEGKPTHRFVEAITVDPVQEMGEHSIVIRIVGNAFLHSMVRIIIGTLVDVGRHKHPPEWIAEILAAGERAVAGQTAPPEGLTLWHVDYPEECWL